MFISTTSILHVTLHSSDHRRSPACQHFTSRHLWIDALPAPVLLLISEPVVPVLPWPASLELHAPHTKTGTTNSDERQTTNDRTRQ